MAELGALPALKEDLTCPICLGIYSSPVSLGCGHSFCKECLQEARSCRQGPFGCPLCCAQADPAMELQPNVQLSSIVQKLLDAPALEEKEEHEAQCEEKGESAGLQDEVILCDFCLQESQPAVKTCLSCEASLCKAHLSKHSMKNPLKHHVLMEPCDDRVLAERRCPQHSKLLECYCVTDSVCICVLCCVTSSHKNHRIISLEEAFDQAQSDFAETLEAVKTHEAALNQRIASLLEQEEEVKTEESLRRNRLESLFKEMCLQLDNDKREALKILSHSEEQQLSEVEAEIQKQKEEKDVASCDVEELEALRDQKDLLVFTKAFTAIQARKPKSVPKKSAVELPKPPIILDELTTCITLKLFRKFLSDMKSLFKAPPVHEHLTAPSYVGHGRSVTIFAPHVYYSGSGYAVSQQSYAVSQQSYAVSQQSYAISPVQSDQGFSEGCHFWEVDTSNAKCWKLGTVHSNFECCLEKSYNSYSNQKPHYFLCVSIGQVMITKKDFPTSLKVVRVELDCGRNALTFYDVSVKDGDPDERLKLIETVVIPLSYPAYAKFIVTEGTLKLL